MIIITRPSPYGEELVHLCASANLPAQHLPLYSMEKGLDVDRLQSQLNQLKHNNIVIVTSPQVVTFVHAAKIPVQFPEYLQYFAIGCRTATLFQALSKHPICYPEHAENSEGLLAYFNQIKLNVNNNHVLILCGNQGRTIIKDRLKLQGAIVENSYIYKRTPILYSPSIFDDDCQEKMIVVTSIEHLLQLEFYCQTTQKKQYSLIASAIRIANEAKTLGWQHVYVAENANNQNLFSTISTLCHNAQ